MELSTLVSVQDNMEKQNSTAMISSNISSGGVFLKTKNPIPVRKKVKIKVLLHPDKFKTINPPPTRIEVVGKVVRTDRHGMAVQFDKAFRIIPIGES